MKLNKSHTIQPQPKYKTRHFPNLEGTSTKDFCHAERILTVKGVGVWVNPLKICDENLFSENVG